MKPVARRPEREGYARRSEGHSAPPLKWRGGLGRPAVVSPPLGSGKIGEAGEALKRRKRVIDDAVDRMAG